MTHKIPKQMDNSAASRYVDKLAMNIQDGLDALSSSSVIFNIIFGFIMSRLWGLINSMQIIVLMPLMSVDFPANVQLVYFFIQDNMNFQIIPINPSEFGIFEFDDSEAKPFTQQFADQGFESLYMLDNINENFMNFMSVLLVIAGVILAELIFLHFERRVEIIMILKQILIYNFLIMVLLENSLQFILFSVINLLNSSDLDTPSKYFSYYMSACFAFGITAIGIFNTVKVLRNSRAQNLNIGDENPSVASLYELLKTSSTMCLLYQSAFLARRWLMAFILIWMSESKVGQIMAMLIVSLAWMLYIARYQPFEEPSLNRLEIFNEMIILTCLYHLLMFTQGLTKDDVMIYNVGWSMDFLLMLQFSVNIFSLGYNTIIKLKAFVQRTRRLVLQRFLKAKEERARYLQEQREKEREATNKKLMENMQREQLNGDNDELGLEEFRPVDQETISQYNRSTNFEETQQLEAPKVATRARPINPLQRMIQRSNNVNLAFHHIEEAVKSIQKGPRELQKRTHSEVDSQINQWLQQNNPQTEEIQFDETPRVQGQSLTRTTSIANTGQVSPVKQANIRPLEVPRNRIIKL